MVLSLKITSYKNIINYRIGCYAKHSRMVTNSPPKQKTFDGLGQETGCANGKTPEKRMSDYAFREKKQSVCRSVVLT